MLAHRGEHFEHNTLSLEPTAIYDTLKLRSTDANDGLCVDIDAGKIIISRTTLIAAVTACAIITCASVLAITVLLYREWTRRRQNNAATAWTRTQRISIMRKEVDDHYSQQYKGCLYHEPENPFLRSNSPVEMMPPERLCEVPAVPPRSIERSTGSGKNKRLTLLFDHGIGLWVPRK